MKKGILYIILILAFNQASAQELNVKLTINTSKVQANKEVFTTLENSLMQLLNERKWTNTSFGVLEKIECSMTLTINEASGSSYKAELQVSSRRPVYNSSYSTSSFNYRDTEVSFEYNDGEMIEFNETNITSNLVAVFAYYSYIVIGLDFDSFSPNGGKPYFERAMNITNAAQNLNTTGWTAFDSDRNRYALALALTEESSAAFHTMWYNYHRLGLDEMATSSIRGRDRIIATLPTLETIYSSRPSSALLLFYGDTKLQEVVSIYSEATEEEKKSAYELLRKIFPTKSNDLNPLRK